MQVMTMQMLSINNTLFVSWQMDKSQKPLGICINLAASRNERVRVRFWFAEVSRWQVVAEVDWWWSKTKALLCAMRTHGGRGVYLYLGSWQMVMCSCFEWTWLVVYFQCQIQAVSIPESATLLGTVKKICWFVALCVCLFVCFLV